MKIHAHPLAKQSRFWLAFLLVMTSLSCSLGSNPPTPTPLAAPPPATLTPPPGTPPSLLTEHTVVEGDSCVSIAVRFNVTVAALVESNYLSPECPLTIGQTLQLPPPTPSADLGLIAFTSSREGDTEIYVMRPDGSGLTNLTRDRSAFDSDPQWSPDGAQIAFISTRTGQSDLFVMNADGTQLLQLTHLVDPDLGYQVPADQSPTGKIITVRSPLAWSPDGKTLVAVRQTQHSKITTTESSNVASLDLINSDGSGVTTLADQVGSVVDSPRWSIHGDYLAFRADGNIHVIKVNGTTSTTPVKLPCRGDFGWMPNTTRLTCINPDNHIVTMNADGSDPTLFFQSGDGRTIERLLWSPDGAHLLFTTSDTRASYLSLLNADGSGLHELSTHLFDSYDETWATLYHVEWLTWSPDSQWLAFAYAHHPDNTGNPLEYDIAVINIQVEGRPVRRLAYNSSENIRPEWQPRLAQVELPDSAFTLPSETPPTPQPASAPQTPPAPPADLGLIAFASSEANDADIYVMQPDGSGLTNLTHDPALDYNPQWSPDGSRIAFISKRNDRPDLFVMDLDGNHLTQLTHVADSNLGYEYFAWSPDGKTLAAFRDIGVGDGTLSGSFATTSLDLINSDGSGVTPLTEKPLNAFFDFLQWSSNGEYLAFGLSINDSITILKIDGVTSANPIELPCHGSIGWLPNTTRLACLNSDNYIILMDADGSNPIPLIGPSDQFLWSPDGAYLVFATYTASDSHLFLVKADGSGLRELPIHSFDLNAPSSNRVGGLTWSPDSQWVAYGEFTYAGYEAYPGPISIINIQATGQQPTLKLLPDSSPHVQPQWQPRPQGEHRDPPPATPLPPPVTLAPIAVSTPPANLGLITFTSFETASEGVNTDIYVVRPDGSQLTNLTRGPAFDFGPQWSPDGSRIAFISNRDSPSPGQKRDIFVMDADGTHLTQLTHTPNSETGSEIGGYDQFFAWAPDGKTLAAFRTIERVGSDVAAIGSLDLIHTDGSGVTSLVKKLLRENGNLLLYWSSNGEHLAFTDLGDTVTVLKIDGATVSNSTKLPCALLDWAPNTARLACLNADKYIILMDADGSNPTPLVRVDDGQKLSALRWSPDGAQLVFATESNTGSHLFIVNADKSGLRELPINSDDILFSLSWSPDKQWLVYNKVRHTTILQGSLGIINIQAQQGQPVLNPLPGVTDYTVFPQWQPQPPLPPSDNYKLLLLIVVPIVLLLIFLSIILLAIITYYVFRRRYLKSA